MICWYCHWGWPKPVADVYLEALQELGGDSQPLLFGFAHVVWEDENFDGGTIRHCIKECKEAQACAELYPPQGRAAVEIGIVKKSLEKLLAVPEEVRCCVPSAYFEDGEHPEHFPPPAGLEMVKGLS